MAKVKENLSIKYGKGSLHIESLIEHIPLEIIQNKKFDIVFQGNWYTGGIRTLPRSIYEYTHLLVFVQEGGPTPVIVPITSLQSTLNASGTRMFKDKEGKRHLAIYSAQLTFDRANMRDVTYVDSFYVDIKEGVVQVPTGANAGVITALIGIL